MEFEVVDVERKIKTRKDKKGAKIKTNILKVKMQTIGGEKLTLELDGKEQEPTIGDCFTMKENKIQKKLGKGEDE